MALENRLALKRHVLHAFISLAIIFVFYFSIRWASPDIELKHKLMMLNVRLTTQDFHNLIETSLSAALFNEKKFRTYVSFFELFLNFFPNSAEINGLMGFCQYHLGNKNAAIQFYKKAVGLAPDHFWFSYNLALILFQLNDINQSQKYFLLATQSSLPKTLNLIRETSKVYPVFLYYDAPEFKNGAEARLNAAYSESWVFLMLAARSEKNYKFMLEIMNAAIQRLPEYRDIFYYYGAEATLNFNDSKNTIKFIQEAVQRNPELKKELEPIERLIKDRTHKKLNLPPMVFKTYLPDGINMNLQIF